MEVLQRAAKSSFRQKQKLASGLRRQIKEKKVEQKEAKLTLQEVEELTKGKDAEIAALGESVDILTGGMPKELETKIDDRQLTDTVREVCIELMCKLSVSA
ncbi:hypothetical protein ElyMa_006024300 [Elysia marginata]|uniref:Uncharacterized protein n=1 Tax=Elysia marginata TaxID=1093978 RepID=A0AAV4GJS2_9GAST|nr:hypothetical protein ElyMa_006024300 [Elysia marginata]